MPKHDVTVKMPPRPLKRQDVSFLVKQDNAVLGTLRISNGSIVWFPKGTTNGHKVGWTKFDQFMKDQPRLEAR